MVRALVAAASLAGIVGITERIAAAEQVDLVEHHASWLQITLDVWETVEGRVQLQKHTEAKCSEHLKALAELNPDGKATFELKRDVPGLKAGTHRWPEARPACDAIVAAVAHHQLTESFAGWANALFDEKYVKNCLSTYDDAIKGGVSPTEVITIHEITKDASGQNVYNDVTLPMEEHYKKCVAAKAKYGEKLAAIEAPYRKVLKADKLSFALDRMNYIYLPRGVAATPKTLAASNVWFLEGISDNTCADGQKKSSLQRFQFNAQQKLVSTTSREFCGRPPASAYK